MTKILKYIDLWPVLLSGMALIVWLTQLEARVNLLDLSRQKRKEVEEKVFEKFEKIDNSILEVKLGVTRIEAILDKRK